jgi:hypothetical protein
MKIFKIVLSTGDPIAIYDQELAGILEMIESGQYKLIRTKRGVFNPSFMVSIVVHKELMVEVSEEAKYGHEFRLPSPFADAIGELGDKTKMLK